MVGSFSITSIAAKDVIRKPNKRENKYMILYFNYNIKNLDFDIVVI